MVEAQLFRADWNPAGSVSETSDTNLFRKADCTQGPGKDPALPSPYRPISLLDTIGKIFEKIILARILHKVSERGLLRDEQFGFRPRHITSLQLSCIVQRITRNFDEKRLTGAVFLDVAKAFDTVWIDGLLYKLTLLNFPSYIAPKAHRTSGDGRSKRSSRRPRHCVEACGLGWLRADWSPLSSSGCMSTTFPHPRTTSS
jgi:hypothetical protein